jgi:plastocyanin
MPTATSLPRPLLAFAALLGIASGARAGDIVGKVDATPAKYLEETVVYVEKAEGPSAPKTAVMDQKGMKFVPHVLTITVGDSVKFLNSDGVDHNVYTTDNEGYNLGTFSKGTSREHVFSAKGVYSQLCSVHPEMLAWVFVGQNPHSAAVDPKDGTFKISGVPAGTYSVAVWNPKLKAPAQSVTVPAAGKVDANFSVKR